MYIVFTGNTNRFGDDGANKDIFFTTEQVRFAQMGDQLKTSLQLGGGLLNSQINYTKGTH